MQVITPFLSQLTGTVHRNLQARPEQAVTICYHKPLLCIPPHRHKLLRAKHNILGRHTSREGDKEELLKTEQG